jgi:hypothetical protein
MDTFHPEPAAITEWDPELPQRSGSATSFPVIG